MGGRGDRRKRKADFVTGFGLVVKKSPNPLLLGCAGQRLSATRREKVVKWESGQKGEQAKSK